MKAQMGYYIFHITKPIYKYFRLGPPMKQLARSNLGPNLQAPLGPRLLQSIHALQFFGLQGCHEMSVLKYPLCIDRFLGKRVVCVSKRITLYIPL